MNTRGSGRSGTPATRPTSCGAGERAIRQKYAVRKAKERGATEIELVPPLEVFERDEWMCHICGGHVEMEDVSLDHIVPIALGGGHTWANLACSHRACNFAKGHPNRTCVRPAAR